MFSSGALIAGLTGSIIYLLKETPSHIKKIFLYHLSVNVTLRNSEDLFDDFCDWVNKEKHIKNTRRFQLYDKYIDGKNETLAGFSDGYHWFMYKGLPIIFNKKTLEHQTSLYKRPEEIVLTFLFRRNNIIIDSLIKDITTQDTTMIEVKTYTTSWQTITKRNKRSINSIIMDKRIKNDLLNDIKTFYSNNKWYSERGILYKRGYLFYGSPGTGKTSIILAIASLFDKKIYTINLKTLSDNTLIDAFIDIPEKSIILLEDIDAISDVVFNRSDDSINDKTGVSLSTLLNVLDGLYSKEDVIIIMTSNYPEKLDKALLRNGRVDKKIEFKFLTKELAIEMFDVFYPDYNDIGKSNFIASIDYPISGCMLQELLLNLNVH